MKLPAVNCRVSKLKFAEANPLSLDELRRVTSPFIPVASYRVFWRRRIKSRMIGLICFFMMVLFLTPACHKEFYPNDQSKITLFLDAKSDWYNTGLRVKKGRTLVFECRGSWAVAPKKESQRWPDTGPEGHGKHPGERVHSKGNHKKELPGVPFGTLLGRIGLTVFSIGDRKEVVMPSSGRLYLVINDYPFYRHDNRGGLIITITAQ